MPSTGILDTRQHQIEVCRGWTPRSLAAFYELIFSAQRFKFLDFLWPLCMAFCDWRINKTMFIVGPGVGKSLFISVTIPAWMIGHDPDTTILGISGGEALMQGFQGAVAELINNSLVWRDIFPTIEPDRGRGWGAASGLWVTGRKPGNPDANYLACGVSSKFLTGKHGKMIIIDDLHNEENSGTIDQCEKVAQQYAKTIVGRADPMGARFLMAGRRWHTEDIYGQLKLPGTDWVVIEIPHERPGAKTLYADIHVPDGLQCVFTDKKCQMPDGTLVSCYD